MKIFAFILALLTLTAGACQANNCHRQDQDLVSCPAPQAARITELRSGQVIVELTIKPDGSVASAKVLSASGHPGWKDPVLQAAKQWRYKPAAHGSVKVVPFDMIVGG